MSYQVIRSFRDKEDKLRTYRRGNTFPAKGEVGQERIDELSGQDNDVGYALIKKVGTDPEPQEDPKENPKVESEFPKHTGGAWYELSNGEKIQGKDEAVAAEAELK
jgi:hypothetical protein